MRAADALPDAKGSFGSIASILTCPRYVRLAGNSGNVDWLLNGSTLGVIHLVYAQAARTAASMAPT